MSMSCRPARVVSWGVLLVALGAGSACSGGGATAATAPEGQAPGTSRPPAQAAGNRGGRGGNQLTPAEKAQFEQAWRMFVTHDAGWEAARDAWLDRGGAAPYVLSENLFRYFWSASRSNRRDEVRRAAASAGRVGAPAVPYFAKALVTDKWPLREPVTTEVFNPDNPREPILKTFTHYDMDDMTRQHAAEVLAYIGAPAVPTLVSAPVLESEIPSTRRNAYYALGAIATDQAVEALGRITTTATSWEDRGAATKALGFAFLRNPEAARPHLERMRGDPDEFVRRKAEEGLAGQTRYEF